MVDPLRRTVRVIVEMKLCDLLQAHTRYGTEETMHALGCIEYEDCLAVDEDRCLKVDLLAHKTQGVQRTKPVGLQAVHDIILTQWSREAHDSRGNVIGLGTKFEGFASPGRQPRPELDGSGLLFFQLTASGKYFTMAVPVKTVRVDVVPDFSRKSQEAPLPFW